MCHPLASGSRLVHLVKHEFSRDSSLWSVHFTGSPLERSHVLLHHLVEKHGGQLGMEQRAELEGYRKVHSAGARVTRDSRTKAPYCLEVIEQLSVSAHRFDQVRPDAGDHGRVSLHHWRKTHF